LSVSAALAVRRGSTIAPVSLARRRILVNYFLIGDSEKSFVSRALAHKPLKAASNKLSALQSTFKIMKYFLLHDHDVQTAGACPGHRLVSKGKNLTSARI
jgi:hypothetical protein